MTDEDEFYEIVGCDSECCSLRAEITITDKETGEVILKNFPTTCGLLIRDSGPADMQCCKCDKYLVPCECGNGLAMKGWVESDKPICMNDDLCFRDNVKSEQLEQLHDENLTDRPV